MKINTSYLNQLVKDLDNYTNEVFLRYNDIDGVDYSLDVDFNKLGVDESEHDEIDIVDAIEEVIGDSCRYKHESKELIMSSGDEIFLNTDENQVVFPSDKERKQEFKKYLDDFHAFILIERWMEHHGYFPGIFSYASRGGAENVEPHKYESDYLKIVRKDKYDFYKSLYDLKKKMDDSTIVTGDLDDSIIKQLPDEITCFEHSIEIMDMDISPSTLKIEMCGNTESINELDLETINKFSPVKMKGRIYKLTVSINLIPNSVRFIMENE